MIEFLQEDVSFDLSNPDVISAWLAEVAASEGYQIDRLSFVFCSDDYLCKINRQFLGKDYLTDIITFPYNNINGIEADLLISTERVSDNARQRRLSFMDELARVLVHGLLHLCGYDDRDEQGRRQMRLKEDAYLEILNRSE